MPPKRGTNGALHSEPPHKRAPSGGRYLSLRALEGLKAYAYKPSGYTILDELHQPVWNCEQQQPPPPPAAAAATERCTACAALQCSLN